MDFQVRGEIARFVLDNFLFGDASRMPADDDSLVETGVVDSTGVLELISFLEDHFGIVVADDETVPENLDSISSLTSFVGSKVGGAVA